MEVKRRSLSGAGFATLLIRPGTYSKRLARLVAFLLAEVETQPTSSGTGAPALVDRHLEDAILGAITMSFRHCLPSNRHSEPAAIVPGLVRRAEAFMRANLDQPLRLGDIVRASRVSERSLHTGFHRHHDTGPMQFLRQLRLHRIHGDLLKGIPGETVTEIAQRWGITHLGRFSQDYRHQFGCPPSKTFRNARDRGFLT